MIEPRGPVTTQTATIPAGGFLSSAVNISQQGQSILRLYFPPAWWPNAWCCVQISPTGSNYAFLYYKNGQPYVLKVIPGAAVVVDPEIARLAYFKLHSGGPTKPIPQAEARSFVFAIE